MLNNILVQQVPDNLLKAKEFLILKKGAMRHRFFVFGMQFTICGFEGAIWNIEMFKFSGVV